jgi:Carbamoyl-phosphate synthetase large chain, oligomerisation domain.
MKNKTEDEIRLQRKKNSILPSYKVVDTCAAEFVAKTPYCYSSYDTENEIEPLEGKKVIILGGRAQSYWPRNRV